MSASFLVLRYSVVVVAVSVIYAKCCKMQRNTYCSLVSSICSTLLVAERSLHTNAAVIPMHTLDTLPFPIKELRLSFYGDLYKIDTYNNGMYSSLHIRIRVCVCVW